MNRIKLIKYSHRNFSTIFSGIQPSGTIHIGNYLGALQLWNELAKSSSETDLHSMTVQYKPDDLKNSCKHIASVMLASGLDPQKCVLFKQSSIPAHAQLMWLLSCILPVGSLKRMTQYKSKSKMKGSLTGLFTYPLLMASDILLYKTNIVPVGQDQVQHVELTREIAEKFNKYYNTDYFALPEIKISNKGSKILNLKDPTKKMSKSDVNDNTRINITDKKDIIAKKIQGAVTDSEIGISYDPIKRPGLSNLLTIYSLFSHIEIDDLVKKYSNSMNKVFKEDLIEVILKEIIPFQEKLDYYSHNEKLLNDIFENGRKKANKIASKTIDEVFSIVGLK